jgi:NitT/TauT family transport system substrate-binding protein
MINLKKLKRGRLAAERWSRSGCWLAAAGLVLSFGLAACAPAPASAPAPVVLKMAILPIIDALPMYVADQAGLFTQEGVKVEFVPVGAAPERDQLIAAGQADGMINETLSTFFFNKDQTQIQIVRYALVPAANAGHFFILTSGRSGITTPAGLKGVEIGISQGTVIEYVADRLLEKQGFSAAEIKTLAVPKMPDRMALLASGGLKAAVLPDPLAALAVQQGATAVLDDAHYPHFGFSVISFRKSVIDQHPEAIRGFLAAIEAATKLINADPAKYVSVLSDQKIIPAPLAKTYQAPPFPAAGVPSEAEWTDALDWAKSKGLVQSDVSYAASVTAAYLPK